MILFLLQDFEYLKNIFIEYFYLSLLLALLPSRFRKITFLDISLSQPYAQYFFIHTQTGAERNKVTESYVS